MKMLRQIVLAGGAIAMILGTPVDARRGGSFGSRGSRTYYAPAGTSLSPGYVPPVSRSMTAPGYGGYAPGRYGPTPAYPSAYGGYRSSPFGGFGGGFLGGLVTGGLLGAVFGHGFGGGWRHGGGMGMGFLAMLVQLLIIGGLIWLVLGFFRRRSGPTLGYAPDAASSSYAPPSYQQPQPMFGGMMGTGGQTGDIAVTLADQQMFERLLEELQDAFAHEDYGRLRAVTTPEVMSYLAEELGANATAGRRNDVTGTHMLDGEVSEAWSENGSDYATVAMRYESIDVMRDRATGAVLSGDPTVPSTTTELWTFVRPHDYGGAWKVSAIQEA